MNMRDQTGANLWTFLFFWRTANGSFWSRAGFLYFDAVAKWVAQIFHRPVYRRASRKAKPTKEKSVSLKQLALQKYPHYLINNLYAIASGRSTVRCLGNRAITRNYRGGDGSGQASSTEYCSDERGRRINLPLLLARRSLKKSRAITCARPR